MGVAHKEHRLIDAGTIVILACTLPLAALVVFYVAGYRVPGWIVAAVLSICMTVALVTGLRLARRR